MFLKRLDVNGFKSFAGRVKLDLEPGVTAVVGPNGSGKSNLADAIRWALGEQSSKSLRLKKNEELVFAGTEKRPRGSLAAVSLLLDNSDGAMAIDFSEIEISRRLYRSGDSEYLLNGRKVRLAELDSLLAAAGFGPSSYAVVGQGTIDTFILATPNERKLLFDEASGIRQYEIRREQTMKRIQETDANLTRVRDILAELGPRLAALSRAVETLNSERELAQNLSQLRRVYLATAQHHYSRAIADCQNEIGLAKTKASDLSKKINQFTKSRLEWQTAQERVAGDRTKLTLELTAQEASRDRLSDQLSAKRAELQQLLDKQESAVGVPTSIMDFKRQIVTLSRRRSELAKKLKSAERDEASEAERLEQITQEINVVQRDLSKLRRQADQSSWLDYINHAMGLLKQVAQGVRQRKIGRAELQLLIYKTGRLLNHAARGQAAVIEEMKQIQTQLTSLMKRREDAYELRTAVVIKVRSLELDLGYTADRIIQVEQQLSAAKVALNNLDLPAPAMITARKSELTQLEKDHQQTAVAIERLRHQLTEETAATGGDVFELAAALESAKAELHQNESRQLELKGKLEHHQTELGRLASQAKAWSEAIMKEPISREPLDALERSLAILESKLQDLRRTDRDAEPEYAEVKERHDFLTTQLGDLEAAKIDLSKVIGQLEELIKDRFKKAFADISKHFGTYFERIFEGGRAALELDLDEAGVYGIEIKASPPGKRVESLAMLSGGERALTGIALLAAILKVNPSPFVVLDEVDAALDDANSARFAAILRDIAKHSQMIVITHNRQTMTAAHTLFGVTMDEHHVSKLLSLRLDEARELATQEK